MVRYNDIAATAAKAVLMILRVGPESYDQDVQGNEFGPQKLAPEFMRSFTFETISAKVVGMGEDAIEGTFHVVMEIDSSQAHIEANAEVVVNNGRIQGLIKLTAFVHHQLDHRGYPYVICRNASVRNGDIILRDVPRGFDLKTVLCAVEATMPEVQLV